MGRSEKTFQTEIRQSLRILPLQKVYHKIVDSGYQNPFDAFMCYDGKFYGLEYKIVKDRPSIPMLDLFKNREHELVALRRVEGCGGKAWILINIYKRYEYNYILAFSPHDYDWLVRGMANRKSVKLDEPILTTFLRIDKVEDKFGEKVWDLTKLIYEPIQTKCAHQDS